MARRRFKRIDETRGDTHRRISPCLWMGLPDLRAAVAAAIAAAVATAAAAATAGNALAGDERDDGRDIRGCDGDASAGDRTGEGHIVFRTAGCDQVNLILTGRETGDDQRLVDFRAAAGAQGEGFAAGIARAGDADGQAARGAALIAAGLQQDGVKDQRRAVVGIIACTAEMHRIAQQRMTPLREGTVGVMMAEVFAAMRLEAAEMVRDGIT